MKIEFTASCFGYLIGGHNNYFEIEIEEYDLEGKTEEEKQEYIEKCIYEYILENLDYGYKIR